MTEPPDADRHEPEHEGIEKYFRPIVEDEGLRPVVISVLIGLATVIGWGILLAVRDRKAGAIVGVLMLALISVESIVRARKKSGRLGAAGWSIIVLWLASVGFAIGGEITGYL